MQLRPWGAHIRIVTAYYWSLFWARIIYLKNSWPYLILFSHIHLFHACYMPIHAHRSTLYCHNNNWYRATIIQSSAACSYFVPLGSEPSPQHSVLQCYQFRAVMSDINFHTNTKQVKTYERTGVWFWDFNHKHDYPFLCETFKIQITGFIYEFYVLLTVHPCIIS